MAAPCELGAWGRLGAQLPKAQDSSKEAQKNATGVRLSDKIVIENHKIKEENDYQKG